jgi:hypothetical protein
MNGKLNEKDITVITAQINLYFFFCNAFKYAQMLPLRHFIQV